LGIGQCDIGGVRELSNKEAKRMMREDTGKLPSMEKRGRSRCAAVMVQRRRRKHRSLVCKRRGRRIEGRRGGHLESWKATTRGGDNKEKVVGLSWPIGPTLRTRLVQRVPLFFLYFFKKKNRKRGIVVGVYISFIESRIVVLLRVSEAFVDPTVLVKNLYLSCDPCICGQIRDFTTLTPPTQA
jgi:hypothetical protein